MKKKLKSILPKLSFYLFFPIVAVKLECVYLAYSDYIKGILLRKTSFTKQIRTIRTIGSSFFIHIFRLGQDDYNNNIWNKIVIPLFTFDFSQIVIIFFVIVWSSNDKWNSNGKLLLLNLLKKRKYCGENPLSSWWGDAELQRECHNFWHF